MGSAIERAAREEAAVHRALHDPLTGLPNRDLFADRLALALARARRGAPRPAVLIADLDQFKLVNDSLGHQAGDELLRAVAPRLADAVRETDTVARFGGDEFVVLCDGVGSEAHALELAQRLAAVLDEPVELAGGPVYVSASFGVAFARPESNADGLLRDADAALYRAKARGRGRCELFDAPMRAQAMARLEIETGLRIALGTDQLAMHYQPVVDMATGETARARGADALAAPRARRGLARRVHPRGRGGRPDRPARPLGAGRGLHARGHAPARRAAREREPLRPPARAPRHRRRRRRRARALRAAGEPAVARADRDGAVRGGRRAAAVLHELKRLGVSLVLDDFGTGYSSLAYLQRFPLDALKIDRAFIAGMIEDGRTAALVEVIATMARTLGLTVIPEGIETEAQREALLALGCRYGQGYLFGRPQPPEPRCRRRPQPPRTARGELGRDRALAAEHGVGDEPRRAGAERDAPGAVAGGHEQALGAGQRAEQRAAVDAHRPRAGAHRDDVGARERGDEAACRAPPARARPRWARAARTGTSTRARRRRRA